MRQTTSSLYPYRLLLLGLYSLSLSTTLEAACSTKRLVTRYTRWSRPCTGKRFFFFKKTSIQEAQAANCGQRALEYWQCGNLDQAIDWYHKQEKLLGQIDPHHLKLLPTYQKLAALYKLKKNNAKHRYYLYKADLLRYREVCDALEKAYDLDAFKLFSLGFLGTAPLPHKFFQLLLDDHSDRIDTIIDHLAKAKMIKLTKGGRYICHTTAQEAMRAFVMYEEEIIMPLPFLEIYKQCNYEAKMAVLLHPLYIMQEIWQTHPQDPTKAAMQQALIPHARKLLEHLQTNTLDLHDHDHKQLLEAFKQWKAKVEA